jgi:hypothetical protein
MTAADFLVWKDCYNRWLKSLYCNFILSCYDFEVGTHIQWKMHQNYNLFCQMIYDASSKTLLPEPLEYEDDDDDWVLT